MENYINIHSHTPTYEDNVFVIRNVFCNNVERELSTDDYVSIGIYPLNINEDTSIDTIKSIEEYSTHKNVLAIGEIGLDRRHSVPVEKQEVFFAEQAKIAEKISKPVIIHCVRCYYDIIALKKMLKPQVPWIIHGFNSKIQTALHLLKHDFYLSFGTALLIEDSNAAKVFKEIPEDKFFLETDDSEVLIKEIYDKAAYIKQMELGKLIKRIEKNFERVFVHKPF